MKWDGFAPKKEVVKIATGTVLFAPLLMNPCASSVPTVMITADYGFDLCRDKLLELFPVEIVHRPRGRLFGANVRRNEKKQRNDKASTHSLAPLWKICILQPPLGSTQTNSNLQQLCANSLTHLNSARPKVRHFY